MTTPTTANARLTVSVAEAASLLGCGTNTVYQLVRTGQLPTVKLTSTGHRKRIPRTALIKLVEGEA